MLLRHAKPGEPIVAIKAVGVGSTGPFEFRDRESRYYVMRWEHSSEGHVIKMPLSLYMEAKHRLAHDILDQRRLAFPMVVLFELPEPVAEPAPEKEAETVTATSPEVETTEEMGEGAESAETVGGGDAEPAPEPASVETVETVTIDPETLMFGDIRLHAAVSDLVREGPQRLNAVAAQLAVEPEEVKFAMSAPSSESELGHAGWVRIKSTE